MKILYKLGATHAYALYSHIISHYLRALVRVLCLPLRQFWQLIHHAMQLPQVWKLCLDIVGIPSITPLIHPSNGSPNCKVGNIVMHPFLCNKGNLPPCNLAFRVTLHSVCYLPNQKYLSNNQWPHHTWQPRKDH